MKNFGRLTAATLAALVATACSDTGTVQPELDPMAAYATIIPTDASSVDLVAGQHTVVGTVEVNDVGGGQIEVVYTITDDNYCITETHVGVADAIGDPGIPTNKPGSPQIGQFPYGEGDIDCADTWSTGPIDLPEDTNGDGQYYVAAHAVVEMCEVVVVPGEGPGTLFGVLDGVTNGDGDLYSVDPTTGDATLIYPFAADPSPDVFSPNALAFDGVRERLYFSNDLDGNDETGPTQIWYYPIDGSLTDPVLAGTVDQFPVYNASWYNGEYYFIPNQGEDLYKATFSPDGNTVTGSSLVCADLLTYSNARLAFGDIAIDGDTGVMHGWARLIGPNEYWFFSVDVDDCSGKTETNVTTTHGTSFNIQLALIGETLWGHQALSNQGDDAGQWYQVDRTTGALTNQFVTSPSFTDISAGPAPTVEERICEGDETAWGDGMDGELFRQQGSWATYFIWDSGTD